MIYPHTYPICEFDTDRNPVIDPVKECEKTLPEKCVITFFRKELDRYVQENNLPMIGELHSEVFDIPIYLYEKEGEKIALTMSFVGSAGAAGVIDELYARGCRKFMICGGAGCLVSKTEVGALMLPTSAVRDEGASYHYLPPSREAEGPKEAIEAAAQGLREMGIPFRFGKTWTTDGFFRETPAMIAKRREEGCITVEMETAAFFAVAAYRKVQLAQILYGGDDVSSEAWDDRSWNKRDGIRSNLIEICLKLVNRL